MIEQLIREKIKSFFKESPCIKEEDNDLTFKSGRLIFSIEVLS
ncbi:MAG: hypothetical protein QXE30_04765 [Candidatus Bathyarchaeia archaeon]